MASLVPPVLCEGKKKTVAIGRGRAGSALGSLLRESRLSSSPLCPWSHGPTHCSLDTALLGFAHKEETNGPPRATGIPPTLTPNADNVPLALFILTLAGCHVHTLLFFADGSRSSRCPRDEVYNRAICPPTESENLGSASSISSIGGHRTEAPIGPSAPRDPRPEPLSKALPSMHSAL